MVPIWYGDAGAKVEPATRKSRVCLRMNGEMVCSCPCERRHTCSATVVGKGSGANKKSWDRPWLRSGYAKCVGRNSPTPIRGTCPSHLLNACQITGCLNLPNKAHWNQMCECGKGGMGRGNHEGRLGNHTLTMLKRMPQATIYRIHRIYVQEERRSCQIDGLTSDRAVACGRIYEQPE